jgi:hypothetical protein
MLDKTTDRNTDSRFHGVGIKLKIGEAKIRRRYLIAYISL